MGRGTPKYSLIADQLERDIRQGRYPVGAMLPTENALMTAYDVGRHTVRTAVQALRARGIVASRQGQGSRVVSDGTQTGYVERVQSFEQLVAFAEDSRRHLLGWEPIEADAALAAKFRCAPGRRLLRVDMVRRAVDGRAKPMAAMTLWMDALFEPVIEILETEVSAVANLLFERFGVETGVVTQSVSATTLSADVARILEGAEDDPALVVERVYTRDADASPHLLALSICAADRTRIVSRFTASAGCEISPSLQ